jgi:hypothetical protein
MCNLMNVNIRTVIRSRNRLCCTLHSIEIAANSKYSASERTSSSATAGYVTSVETTLNMRSATPNAASSVA